MKILKNILVLLLIVIASLQSYAQKGEFLNYTFSDKPYSVGADFINEEEVIIERNVKVEFVFEDNEAYEICLVHEKKLINSDNAIERNNRVYIPVNKDGNLLTNKSRVILQDGNIIELKSTDVKQEVDEQKGMVYNYFAVNGLEKGAVIEKFHIIKRRPEIAGNYFTFQRDFPILSASVEVIFPEHLMFASASYNGFPNAESRLESYPKKNSLYAESTNIPSIPSNERQSNISKNIQRFAYKLDQNNITGVRNIYNHADYGKSLYESYYAKLSKDEDKALNQFVKNITNGHTPLENIQAVEKYIKENIQYNRYFNTNKNLADVIKNKQADLFDLMRLYAQVYKKMNIAHEIALTTERFESVFDPNFESHLNFKYALFYFPEEDVYLEPAATIYRVPLFDEQYGGNHGLFIKSKVFNGIEVPITEVRIIDFPKNQDLTVMDINIDFTQNITEPFLTSKIQFNGYDSMNFQPAKDFADPVEYKEMLNYIGKNYTFESELESVQAENEGLDFVGKKPFIINLTANGKDLLTKAGPNYIFKVGETIGKQMEMYEEKERVLPIEINNPHSYDRTITLYLPEGFTIKNPEVFNMNYELKHEGKVVADFISTYEIKGNQIIVKNTESYNFVELPAQLYPQYQKVINAAADFNKLSIILEKT